MIKNNNFLLFNDSLVLGYYFFAIIKNIDNYEVCEENGKFLAASFVDYEGIPHTIELTKELEEYLKEVRKEEFREKYRTNKYIDTGINNEDDVFEIKISINTNKK